jgi:hypothetical protein
MMRPEEVSDDMLMALADGELNQIDAERLRRAMEADPVLAARYADFAATRRLLQAAYPLEPVPDRLVAAVTKYSRSHVVPLRRPVSSLAGWGMAIAASIVLALGGFWIGRNTVPMTDSVALATAGLPTGGEARLPDGSTARVLASYDTALGLCRLIGQEDLRHVICRNPQAGTWVTALSVHAGNADSFMPASDLGIGLIDRLLDDIGAGPALDAAAERALLR